MVLALALEVGKTFPRVQLIIDIALLFGGGHYWMIFLLRPEEKLGLDA